MVESLSVKCWMRYVDKDATQSADWDKWTDNAIQTAGGGMMIDDTSHNQQVRICGELCWSK